MTEAWNSLPEIQLFTVISLVIALTGAAYSVVLAFKEDHKAEIDTYTTNALTLLQGVERVHNESNLAEAQNAYKQIFHWEKWWKRWLRTPIWVFCIFVLSVTIYVLCQMDPSKLRCKWCIFQVALLAILIIDIFSLGRAHKACNKIKSNNDQLELCNRTAKDQEKQERLIREQQSKDKSAGESTEESTAGSPSGSTTYPKGKIG